MFVVVIEDDEDEDDDVIEGWEGDADESESESVVAIIIGLCVSCAEFPVVVVSVVVWRNGK